MSEQQNIMESNNRFLKGSMLDLFFSFEGRITRGTYWIANLLMGIGYLPLAIMIGIFFTQGVDYSIFESFSLEFFALFILAIPLYIVMVVASFAISIKRYHDRGKSAWWMFILLIPYMGAIWQMVELGFLEGDKGENKYGSR